MAIGKVGSFATVEPAIVDFGAMAAGTIDKIQAQRQAKEKAKDDKRKEIEKLGGLGALKSTNIKGFNQGMEAAYAPMRVEYAEAKERGDLSRMRELQEETFSMNNIIDNVVKQHDFYLKNEEKFDSTYFSRATKVLENIDIANMDVKRGKDGRVRFTIYGDPERTEILFDSMTPNEIVDSLKIPYKFNEDAMIKSFVKKYALDDIEELFDSGGLVGTQKEKRLEDNPRVLSAIKDKAIELSNDSTAMAFFGKTINKYESDVRGYSTEEKEQAQSFFEKKLKDAYKAEFDFSVQQKRVARAGKKDEEAMSSPQQFTTYANLPAPKSGQPFSVADLSSPIKFGVQDIRSVVYDPDANKIYFGLIKNTSEGTSESDRTPAGGGVSGRFGFGSAGIVVNKSDEGERNAHLGQVLSEVRGKLFLPDGTPVTDENTLTKYVISRNL